MTDDELAVLLRETFRSREHLADPETARALALRTARGPVARRRWPAVVSAAATVGVLVGGTSLAARTLGDPAPPAAGPAPGPTAERDRPTYEDNRAVAAAASERMLEQVPLPRGAVRLAGEPPGWPDGGTSLGPSDGSLTRTSWWSVPVSGDELADHLRHHRPPGARAGMSEGGIGSDGLATWSYGKAPDDPAAYTGVTLLVQWLDVGARTLVRADTFTAARGVPDPRSLVTGTVSEMVLEYLPGNAPIAERPRTRLRLTGAASQGQIAAVVDALNGLPASIRPAPQASCPYPGNPPASYRLTVRSSDATWTFRLEPACWGQVEVRRDGVPLRATLDPDHLDGMLSGLLARTDLGAR